jgi:hypothetical protein
MVGRRGKSRPRCVAKGCGRMLRQNQAAACSDQCADRIINTAILHLKQCGITLEELTRLYT